MLILGIDPGSHKTGYGLVESRGSRLVLIEQGILRAPTKASVPARLAYLNRGLSEVLDRNTPDLASLETPFYGLNVKSLIVLCQARGALLVEIARRQIEILDYSPAEVKSAVTGNGRATKAQVARMVGLLVGQDPTSWSTDASDAMAVAICCARRYRLDRLALLQKPRK